MLFRDLRVGLLLTPKDYNEAENQEVGYPVMEKNGEFYVRAKGFDCFLKESKDSKVWGWELHPDSPSPYVSLKTADKVVTKQEVVGITLNLTVEQAAVIRILVGTAGGCSGVCRQTVDSLYYLLSPLFPNLYWGGDFLETPPRFNSRDFTAKELEVRS